MSSDEQDRPRKTLTIKPKSRADAPADDTPRRARTGARARLVAQQERAREQTERLRNPDAPAERERGAPREAPRGGPRGGPRNTYRGDATSQRGGYPERGPRDDRPPRTAWNDPARSVAP